MFRSVSLCPARVLAVAVLLVLSLSALFPSTRVALAEDFSPSTATELIAAINDANANGEPDVINLTEDGVYTLDAIDNEDTSGPSGLPQISSDITINGNGAVIERDTSDGTPEFRILMTSDGGILRLNEVTVTNGAGAIGGGIINYGRLEITDSTVSGNSGTFGGGISNYSRLEMTNSTVTGNTVDAFGGGVRNDGAATITNSTISGNSSHGIHNYGTLDMTNSTISGNSRDGIDNRGPLTIANSLVAENGGRNYDPFSDSTLIDGGYNLSSDGSFDFDTASTGSMNRTDPQLDPDGLQDNGGPTRTIALLTGSPAIDAIPVTDPASFPDTDQRGVDRPQGSFADIGAYEWQGQTTSLSLSPATGDFGGTVTLSATLTAGSVPLDDMTVTFSLGSTAVGEATTDANGVATVPDVSLAGYDAGTHPDEIHANFAHTGDYHRSTATADLTVSQAVAIITWDDPEDIVYGTPLGEEQLDATANVAGTFVYDPAAGTVLDPGTHTLSVNFTPEDGNYVGSDAEVTIQVLGPQDLLGILIEDVGNSEIAPWIKRTLGVTLILADSRLESGQTGTTCNMLHTFEFAIERFFPFWLRGQDETDAFVEDSRFIREILGCASGR